MYILPPFENSLGLGTKTLTAFASAGTFLFLIKRISKTPYAFSQDFLRKAASFLSCAPFESAAVRKRWLKPTTDASTKPRNFTLNAWLACHESQMTQLNPSYQTSFKHAQWPSLSSYEKKKKNLSMHSTFRNKMWQTYDLNTIEWKNIGKAWLVSRIEVDVQLPRRHSYTRKVRIF